MSAGRSKPTTTIPATVSAVPESLSFDPGNLPRQGWLAYAAGLIDGEGCVGVYYNARQEGYQLRITVEMTKTEGLCVLAHLFGGRAYHKQYPSDCGRADVYSWMVFGSRAETALHELTPYLQVKKPQAETVLRADWHSFAGRPLTAEQQRIRAAVAEKIHLLNKRGRNG